MSSIATKLFDTDGVSVFRIPPGPPQLSSWNLNGSNIVWSGSLRVIEKEQISDTVLPFLRDENASSQIYPPHVGLRLKVELYNADFSFDTSGLWAEAWYNPKGDFSTVHNGEESIQSTDSSKYYKIIVQFPFSGYHCIKCDDASADANQMGVPSLRGDEKSDGIVQVALGLKFDESFSAISFYESLEMYRRHYRNYEEQYRYELRLMDIESKLSKLSLKDVSRDYTHSESDDESDDFGDFVSS